MGHISQRGIGLVGARALPDSFRAQISGVVAYLIQRGYHLHSGGALGADLFALQAIIAQSAYSRGVLFSAWSAVQGFPREVQPLVEDYLRHDGQISWGMIQPNSARGLVVTGLLARNQRLVRASAGLVTFLYGDSRGTIGTIIQAIQRGIRVVVFVCGGGAELPRVSSGVWRQLRCKEACWAGAYIFRPD
jgi:hypothetical protein